MKNFLFLSMLLFFFSTNAQIMSKTLPVSGGHFTVQSHLSSVNGNCYTVWVGLFYLDNTGENMLITFGDVTVGSDCPKFLNETNVNCENIIYKGDYIKNSDSKNLDYCLIDCLKDERIYNLYVIQRDKILTDNQK